MHLLQCLRMQCIVMIQERDEVTTRQTQRIVRGSNDSAILFTKVDPNSVVQCLKVREALLHPAVGGVVVHKTPLPIFMGLGEYRTDALFEGISRRIEYRSDDAEPWAGLSPISVHEPRRRRRRIRMGNMTKLPIRQVMVARILVSCCSKSLRSRAIRAFFFSSSAFFFSSSASFSRRRARSSPTCAVVPIA